MTKTSNKKLSKVKKQQIKKNCPCNHGWPMRNWKNFGKEVTNKKYNY